MKVNKNEKVFYEMEWKDAKKILKMNKSQLLWQIWIERANKVNCILIAFLCGLLLITLINYIRG